MSDSEHSTVTYTSVSFPVEDDSDIGSPGVDGPPIMPEDLCLIMVLRRPCTPEYMPHEDEILPAKEQPLPADTLPTQVPPGYVLRSNSEEELEEDDENPEEDPADYPADREDDDDDDDDEDEDEDEEEEKEYQVRSTSIIPVHTREDLYGFVDMVDVPPRCLTSRELDYGITDTWDDLVGAIDEIAPTTIEGVNQRVTDLATIVEEETTSMYGIMEDAQDDRSLLRARVNLLYRDRPVHRRLAVMIEREAKMAREAWGLSMDSSDYARSDVMSLRTTVVAQSALISELQSADHRRQRVISELLASDHKRQVQLTKTLRLLKGLQTQMVEFQRQHGPAEGPSQPDAPGEAGSSS
ncbi:hypothetical protein Tco_0010861 [Tanacetum coccineum]